MPFAKPDTEPVYLTQMKALLKRHPNAAIIWAHIGLGRVVHPVQVSAEAAERNPNHVEIVEAMLTDPALSHVNFDISWDEVAKYAVAVAAVDRARGRDAEQVPGPVPVRHRHGGAGERRRRTSRVFDMWAPVWRAADAGSEPQVRKGNYERLFDEGRRRVRAWERATRNRRSRSTTRSQTTCDATRSPDELLHGGALASCCSARRRRARARRRRRRPTDADAWRSTASARPTRSPTSSRTIRTGTTSTGRRGCPRSRTSSARTATST